MKTGNPETAVTLEQRVRWQQLGVAMHFVGRKKCNFRLATLVENRFVVSTIGEWFPFENEPMQPLGGGHVGFYETYVFLVGGFSNGMPLLGNHIDGMRASTAQEANARHIKMCESMQLHLNKERFQKERNKKA